MKEKKYRSGFERYQAIAEKIKEQCLQSREKTTNTGETLYHWNGFKVYIAKNYITIYDKDEEIFLHLDNMQNKCEFGLRDIMELVENGYDLYGYYSPYGFHLEHGYGEDASYDIELIPDNISIILLDEIKKAEAEFKQIEYDEEMAGDEGNPYDYDTRRDFNSIYIEKLKKALDFFGKIEELALDEKTIEEPKEQITKEQEKKEKETNSSKQKRLEKLSKFFDENPELTFDDVLFAATKRWIKESDRTNAEKHLIETMEQGKIGKKDSIVQE